MSEIHIPFTHGQNEAVDAKLLPQGLFLTAQNVRYRKDGRLGLRYGYDFDSAAPSPSTVIASYSYKPKHNIHITARNGVNSPKAQRIANGVYSAVNAQDAINLNQGVLSQGSIGAATRTTIGDPVAAVAGAFGVTDVVASGNFIYFLASSYLYGATTGSASSDVCNLYMLDAFSGAMVRKAFIPGTTNNNGKLLIINGLLCCFFTDTSDHVQMQAFVLGTLATSGSTINVVTAFTASAYTFDVSDGGASTEGYLIYQSAANTLTFGTVSSAGVFSSLNTITTTNAVPRPSITPTQNAPTDQIAIVWLDGASFTTGNAKITVYRRSTSSFLVATTTTNSTGRCTSFPVIAAHIANDWVCAYNVTEDVPSVQGPRLEYVYASLASNVLEDFYVAAKPVTINGQTWVPMVDVAATPAADSSGPAIRGTYFLQSLGANSVSNGNVAEAAFGVDVAQPANLAATWVDPRRRFASTAAISQDPGLSAVVVALPIGNDHDSTAALFRMESGAFADMLSSALLNDELFIAGASNSVYDGSSILAVWYPSTPRIASLADSATAGSLTAGTYQYVIVREYTDALGYKHRSRPSLPMSVVISGPGRSTFGRVYPSHGTQVAFGTTLYWYRTTNGGSVFYLSGSKKEAGFQSFQDTISDALLQTHEVLYTQGARGGLSGVHENDMPPPAKYVCAGSSRLLLGGMELPAQVQWSKLQTDGEPITWANDPQWRAVVDGKVTGVAELDGTWVIFTRDTVWTVVGDGPDDTGAGSFAEPQRLPSSVGCISHKSIVRFGGGLMFQSTRGFELLPRGGGDPQWIGQAVRDTLALFPYVSASTFNQVEQVAYWAVTDTAGSTGCLIVYDTRIGEWYVDTFYTRAIKALSVYDGKLIIDGGILETSAFVDDDTGAKSTAIIPILTTGDTRPFGLGGHGRVRKAWLLGEARDVTTAFSITLDVSYDSGKTFTETNSWPIGNLAIAIGDAINGAEHLLQQPRLGGNVRYRWSWSTPSATEGVVFHGMSLDAYQAPGLKRLAAQART